MPLSYCRFVSVRFIPDRALRKNGVPRAIFLLPVAAVMTLASFMNAFADLAWLGGSAALTGFAFGATQVKWGKIGDIWQKTYWWVL